LLGPPAAGELAAPYTARKTPALSGTDVREVGVDDLKLRDCRHREALDQDCAPPGCVRDALVLTAADGEVELSAVLESSLLGRWAGGSDALVRDGLVIAVAELVREVLTAARASLGTTLQSLPRAFRGSPTFGLREWASRACVEVRRPRGSPETATPEAGKH
jgi:hypothetical protein